MRGIGERVHDEATRAFGHEGMAVGQRHRTRDALDANARCLRAKPSLAITVVGMTDPRGTEEYNLALGEGRARTVHRYLTQLGVDEQRATFRSMGEEMATGEDEAGWARDRRADVEVR